MTHALTLGSLTLTGSKHFSDPEHGYWFEVAAEGTEFGSPEAVTSIVQSLLADGSVVRYDRDENRTIPVRVRVHGPTLQAVAHGEAALRMATKVRNELTWQPPDNFAPPSVYETYPSAMTSVQESGWDLDEMVRRVRTFRLNLMASPHARSQNPVVSEALRSGTTTVVVDTCDSATGWTATRNGAPDVATTFWEAGSVSVAELSDAVGLPPETWTLTRPGSVDFTDTPYLVAEMRTIGSVGLGNVVVIVDAGLPSQRFLKILEVRKIADGTPHYRVTWDATGTASTITFWHRTDDPNQVWQGVFVRNISRTDIPPGPTPRQLTRVVEVEGTERTPGSLELFSGGATALGMTVVHTSPEDGSGYSPPLRRWRVSGAGETSNLSAVSQALESILLPNPFVAEVPNRAVPEGGYLLAARMLVPTAGVTAINWAAETVTRGVGQGYVTDFAHWEFTTAHTWNFVPLAVLTLPTLRSEEGTVRIQMSSSVPVELDEAWLFRVDDDCALTVIRDVATARMWLDSPDINSRVPRVWIGDNEHRTDAFHPGGNLYCHGNHTFAPDKVSVFTATSGVSGPAVSMSHYPRWHSNAAS